jgi:hypothetical protein
VGAGLASSAPGTPQPTAPSPSSTTRTQPPIGTYSNDYWGTWIGRITLTSSGKWFDAQIHLYPLLGTGLVTYTLKDSKCFGEMRLTQDNLTNVVLWETITYDRTKCGDGYEKLSLSGSTLKYEFLAHLGDSTPLSTGTLTKTG